MLRAATAWMASSNKPPLITGFVIIAAVGGNEALWAKPLGRVAQRSFADRRDVARSASLYSPARHSRLAIEKLASTTAATKAAAKTAAAAATTTGRFRFCRRRRAAAE